MIKEAILNYINHLEDPAYFASLLGACTTQDLIDALNDLLCSGDHKRVGSTCLFICDVILIAPKYDLGGAFRASFSTSSLIPTLERLVLANNYFIRRHAIYALGKTGSTGSVLALHYAFDALRETDPLILPRLVSEIWCLEEHKRWSLIDTMLTSRHYATRWAVINTVTTWHGYRELDAIKRRCYASLRVDAHPLICAEAEYEYQQYLLEQRLPTLSKAEKKRQRKEIDRHEPAMSFADIECWFSSHLYTSHQNDYSIDDLDRFIQVDAVKLSRARDADQRNARKA